VAFSENDPDKRRSTSCCAQQALASCGRPPSRPQEGQAGHVGNFVTNALFSAANHPSVLLRPDTRYRFFPFGFRSGAECAVYLTCCVLGLSAGMLSYDRLARFPYNYGREVIGLFFPPLFTLCFFSYAGLRHGLSRAVALRSLLLYLILLLPYTPLLLEEVRPTPGDDYARYLLYARNMQENGTLWGSDQLVFPDAGRHFVTQPGYRYFLLLELAVFGKLYRIVDAVNMGILLFGLYRAQQLIYLAKPVPRAQTLLVVLLLLTGPALVSNLLLGLPEWLSLVLLFGAGYSIIKKRYIPAAILLGLLPFFRQNLLPASLLFFLLPGAQSKYRLLITVIFLLPLSLPLLHNLYYAQAWRYFTDVFEYPFLRYQNGHPSELNFTHLGNNLLHYAGIDQQGGRLRFVPTGALFLPLATALFFWLLRLLREGRPQLVFGAIVMSTVAPALLFANAYYPRFELVNTGIMIVAFLLVHAQRFGGKVATRPV